jgi:CubicO group peptidase (beta-lactamase class C family)
MKSRFAFFLLLLPVLFSCLAARQRGLYPLPGEYSYSVPKETGDGLETTSIEGTFFASERMPVLRDFFNSLKRGDFGEIHGVLLMDDGKLVLEEYFPGYRFQGGKADFSANDLHHLASVTKSITSLCLGIALDKGFIKSVDQNFLDFYTDVDVPDREAKTGITLRHLLTMSAGLEWDESTYPYTDLRNDVVRLYISPDPLDFILKRKAIEVPGTRWVYSGAYPNLIGDIIFRASSYKLDRFAREFLYAPLGISESSWIKLNKNFIYASGDAELRPRDLAKIGLLVQNGGVWKGERVISEEWLDLSMRKAIRADRANWYGFYWWLPILDVAAEKRIGPVYMASGWGGQYLIIAPERKLVLVLTGGNYGNDSNVIPILVYILEEFL